MKDQTFFEIANYLFKKNYNKNQLILPIKYWLFIENRKFRIVSYILAFDSECLKSIEFDKIFELVES